MVGDVMLLNWFKEDIQKLFSNHNRIVIVDKNKEYKFLIKSIEDELDITVFEVNDFVSDLEVKYRIEKEYKDKQGRNRPQKFTLIPETIFKIYRESQGISCFFCVSAQPLGNKFPVKICSDSQSESNPSCFHS